MVKIFSAQTVIEVYNVKNALAADGIETQVRNEFLVGARGEIPLNECWVELWLVDANQLDRATRLIDRATTRNPSEAWSCGSCGENVEGGFETCWNCGRERRG